MEMCKQQMIYLETDYTIQNNKLKDLTSGGEQKLLLLEKNFAKFENINLQASFLYKTILQLEKRQLSETISCITGYSNQDSFPMFQVRFEQAYNDNCEWMSEEQLDSLNLLRDQNLFSFYNIPQKTLYSHSSNNFLGWNYIQKNRDKPNQLRLKDIKEMIKQKDIAGNRMINYDTCHHCKHLFKRTSTMGLPIHNYIVTDPFLFSQTECENSTNKKPQVNKKRNCFTMFQKLDGDLVCKRMYCRSCLKQNYDLILADIKDKHDWLCPFCQGNCYCTRCLRNELLMKYKGIYMLLGGDINLIQRESEFEYFSQQMSQSRKKDNTENQLNNNGKILKNSQKYTKLKEEVMQKTLEIENIKQLCFQINKREKYKFEILKENIEIFRQKYYYQTEKEFPSIDINSLNTYQFLNNGQQNQKKHSSSNYSKSSQLQNCLTNLYLQIEKIKNDKQNQNNGIKLDELIQKNENKMKIIQMSEIVKNKYKSQKSNSKKELRLSSYSSTTSQQSSQPSSDISQSSLSSDDDEAEETKHVKSQRIQQPKIAKQIKKSKNYKQKTQKKQIKKGKLKK